MAIKRKWLKVLVLVMLGSAALTGAVNPKEIEDILHIMNETKVEFSIPDDSDKGGGLPPLPEIDSLQSEEPDVPEAENTSGEV
jgi:hypothetical protein